MPGWCAQQIRVCVSDLHRSKRSSCSVLRPRSVRPAVGATHTTRTRGRARTLSPTCGDSVSRVPLKGGFWECRPQEVYIAQTAWRAPRRFCGLHRSRSVGNYSPQLVVSVPQASAGPVWPGLTVIGLGLVLALPTVHLTRHRHPSTAAFASSLTYLLECSRLPRCISCT